MARINYQMEKRQKDLAKQKKREEKMRRKAEQRAKPSAESPVEPVGGAEPPTE